MQLAKLTRSFRVQNIIIVVVSQRVIASCKTCSSVVSSNTRRGSFVNSHRQDLGWSKLAVGSLARW